MDWDRAYSNADFIAGAAEFPPRWAAKAAAFREGLGTKARLNLPYGDAPRQAFDLFMPEAAPRGLLVFVHGGYWLAFGRETWSHLAAGPLARGWAVAMPSYTLAPEARIAQMTVEIGAAVTAAAALVQGPVHVTGHSAGGHLSARMGNANAPVPPEVAARLRLVVPISPLADLEPLTHTKMNEKLRLDAAEVASESPAYLPRRDGCAAKAWVGGAERPSFLWHARLLAEEWACEWQVDPGRHHFDVIEALALPDSPLTLAVTGG